MLVYWSLFLFLSLLSLFETFLKNNKQLYLILFITFVFISGFRYEVGGDWSTYLNYYNFFNNLNLIDFFKNSNLLTHDIGYLLLNFIFNKLSLTIISVNFVSAFIFCFGLFKYCSLFERKYLALLTSFPYLYLVVSMGYTRQSIAIGLTLLAIEKLSKEKENWFLYILFISFLFHKSSIILLLVYFISLIITHNFFVINKTKILITFILMVLITYFTYDLIFEKIFHYFLTDYDSKGILPRIILLLMGLFPTLIFLIVNKNFNIKLRNFYFISIFFVIILFNLYILFPQNGDAAIDRLLLYFLFFNIFGLAIVPDLLKSLINSFFSIILIVLYNFLIVFVWLNYAIHSFAWLPYRNFFIINFL